MIKKIKLFLLKKYNKPEFWGFGVSFVCLNLETKFLNDTYILSI